MEVSATPIGPDWSTGWVRWPMRGGVRESGGRSLTDDNVQTSGPVTVTSARHVLLSVSSPVPGWTSSLQHSDQETRQRQDREDKLGLQLPARLSSERPRRHQVDQDKNLEAGHILHRLLDIYTTSKWTSPRRIPAEDVFQQFSQRQELQGMKTKRRGRTQTENCWDGSVKISA